LQRSDLPGRGQTQALEPCAARQRRPARWSERTLFALAALALIAGAALALGAFSRRAPPAAGLTPAATLAPAATPPAAETSITRVTPMAVRPAAGDLNVLLLGCDRALPSWRTDAIIVVAVRPQAGFVAMLSIPRDLWVAIPGWGEERINAADYHGEIVNGAGRGPALVAATLQENLGIGVDVHVRIRFDGLVRVIDALGGVDVTADRAYPDIGVPAGPQHMDGELALAYARDRTYTSDLDRGRRQQQLLLAMRQAALRPATLARLPGLLAALPDVAETDLSPGQTVSLAGLALRLKPERYRTRTLDESLVRGWTTPQGAMVLLPDRARIAQAWAELISP